MIRKEIDEFTKDKDKNEYLSRSQKGNSITATQVYRILANAGEFIGRNDIGTHTMKKTFGYHYYQKTKDVAGL